MDYLSRLKICSTYARNFEFSKCLREVQDVARQTQLYSMYRNDFAEIRNIGFGLKNWDLATAKMHELIRKLAEELEVKPT